MNTINELLPFICFFLGFLMFGQALQGFKLLNEEDWPAVSNRKWDTFVFLFYLVEVTLGGMAIILSFIYLILDAAIS